MRRYFVRPKGWDDEGPTDPNSPTITVFERDRSPVNTGLYDHLGNELWASDEMEPIGFVTAKGK